MVGFPNGTIPFSVEFIIIDARGLEDGVERRGGMLLYYQIELIGLSTPDTTASLWNPGISVVRVTLGPTIDFEI